MGDDARERRRGERRKSRGSRRRVRVRRASDCAVSTRLAELHRGFVALEAAVACLSGPPRATEHGEPVRDDPGGTRRGSECRRRAPNDRRAAAHGRSLVVLGGASLLRALTESGRVPGQAGAILGLGYATLWLAAADRQPGSPSQLSRVFHGLAALVIAVPLLWEATTRFQLFAPGASAATLGVFTLVTLAVAWHRHLQILAGVATIGAALAMPALAIATECHQSLCIAGGRAGGGDVDAGRDAGMAMAGMAGGDR